MISDEEAARWIDGLAMMDQGNEIVILALFACFGVPKSYLDVGSGTGAMVNMAERLGIEVNGMDQLPRPNHPRLYRVDLTEPQHLGRTYELVTCIEVAEHLPEESADTLVDTIIRHAQHRIVFTSAMPGQAGHGHINLKDAYYWRTKFVQRGWTWNAEETYRAVAMLMVANHPFHHIEANLQVFTRL